VDKAGKISMGRLEINRHNRLLGSGSALPQTPNRLNKILLFN